MVRLEGSVRVHTEKRNVVRRIVDSHYIRPSVEIVIGDLDIVGDTQVF